MFGSCRSSDHIHIRCPGNVGLLGCLVQIFFPNKIKTAKYAGNWDPKSPQPLSYRVQKWILRNNSITKNIKVLVYGDWNSKSKNIVPFFTASFSEKDRVKSIERDYTGILEFVFSGSLVEGKRPLLAIRIVEELNNRGISAKLDIYGHGLLSKELMDYVETNEISQFIRLHGNVDIERIKNRLKTSHFIILPSRSEGWPKAIVEGMFFGTIPIVTDVSCIRELLDYGSRGIVIEPNLVDATKEIVSSLDSDNLNNMSQRAAQWSQKYTLEYFESQIKSILLQE
ncbi:MAG: glycosyltransferase [Flavobacteriaceae bacterium]|nr:glycosyltransferase [Bacteroidia bacterium]NNL59810.1 glycosyltransferase [Flavobacteriaceae bacterium]